MYLADVMIKTKNGYSFVPASWARCGVVGFLYNKLPGTIIVLILNNKIVGITIALGFPNSEKNASLL